MASREAWDAEVDVVVLGFGSAGSAAAISARDAGASVLLLEKMPEGREGGNTRISGGIWFHNPDVEGQKTYLRALSEEYPIPEAIISAWSEETARNTDWIEEIGGRTGVHGDYAPEYPELTGSEAYGGYRGIDGEMGGGRLYSVLASAVRERGVDVRLETPARELIQDRETGEILGVVAESQGVTLRFRARRGVVIATGGFEANPEMVRDYLRLPAAPVWGSPAGTGDGIKMAQKVGADLWHMDNMMTTVGLRAPGFESGFYVAFMFAFGFLYTGADGTRCVNELPQVGHGQAILHGNYKIFPDQKMHVIFDEATRRAGPLSPPAELLDVGWNVRIETIRSRSRRAGSSERTRSPSWPGRSVWRPKRSRRPSVATTAPARRSSTSRSAAMRRRSPPSSSPLFTLSSQPLCLVGATAVLDGTSEPGCSTPLAP